jgi:hypothetical protein
VSVGLVEGRSELPTAGAGLKGKARQKEEGEEEEEEEHNEDGKQSINHRALPHIFLVNFPGGGGGGGGGGGKVRQTALSAGNKAASQVCGSVWVEVDPTTCGGGSSHMWIHVGGGGSPVCDVYV